MYKVLIDDKEYHVSLEDVAKIDVIEIDKSYHIIHNNKSLEAHAFTDHSHPKTGSVSIGHNQYDYEIMDKVDQQVDAMGLNVKEEDILTDVKAPMPGLIIDIMVQVGDNITAGDSLLILEAMKMENVLKASGDGVVKSINYNKSESVEKGAVLIELE